MWSDVFKTIVTDEISKTLIKPEIIPPLHGDKITEPMVCQLVRDGVGQAM